MATNNAINAALPIAVTNGGTGLSSTTANQLLYSSSNSVIAGLATADNAVLVTNGSGVPSLSTTLPSGLAATNLTLTTPALGTPASGTLTSCTGYTVANLSDVGWTDFSGTIGYTGFSGTPTTTYATYKKIGKTLFFNISVSGTSNATGFTITNMPATCATTTEGGIVNAVNNSSSSYTSNWQMTASGTTLTMLLSNNSAGWTNSGTKGVIFQGFYETT